MTTTNDITGDSLTTKTNTDAYRDGWERIFGNKEKVNDGQRDTGNKHDGTDVDGHQPILPA
jgi:hypothetical protein